MRSREIINKNIIKYCKLKKMSYKELSNKLGKQDDFIENVLANKYKRIPNLDMLDNMAKIFKIPVARFFDGWEELYNEQN